MCTSCLSLAEMAVPVQCDFERSPCMLTSELGSDRPSVFSGYCVCEQVMKAHCHSIGPARPGTGCQIETKEWFCKFCQILLSRLSTKQYRPSTGPEVNGTLLAATVMIPAARVASQCGAFSCTLLFFSWQASEVVHYMYIINLACVRECSNTC